MLKKNLLKLQEEPNLEKRFFRHAAFYTSILSVLSLVINIVSNLGIVLCIMSIVYSILSFTCFYYSKFDNKYKLASNIFFIGLILLLDISYFLSGGLDSSITYVFIITFLILNLVIKRERLNQTLLFVFFILNLLLMFDLENLYPHLITPYPDLSAKNTDLIFSFGTVSFLISIIINFFKSTYEKLLNDIEIKNKELIISEKQAKEEKEKAEKANNAKKDFLSVMSHEIRTPLNAIISIINLLEKNNEKKDEKENLLETLKDSSENLLALVSNILDFNKIDSSEIKIEEIDFNLKKTIQSIINVYKIQSKERNNLLSVSFEGFDNFNFLGDSLRISQILINLISNAIKFTQNGSINLKINLIEDNAAKNTGKIYFEIKDTGIGVSKDRIDDIFEKFIQENSTITRKYGGSGLGLSITKKLIELMNSKIELKSEVGVGSTFYFYLELKKSNKPEEAEITMGFEDLSKINVLLVEDNKINIMVVTKFFDKWKLNYEVAENGLIAVEKFQTNNFNLILMDLQMPEMDGFTATQEIRKKNMTIPIIALTANSMSEEKEKCLASGFNDYITKPFKADNLRDKIIFFFNLSSN